MRPYFRFVIWALPLSFFAYQFILRLWPSLMMQQIMVQFNIDATAFGILASAYYYGYALMQLPTAILLDRYGPRIALMLCATTCGVAMWVFSHTDSWVIALLSRFLIGCGSAGGFLITSAVISLWFPAKDYGRMVGYTFTIGLLGAVYGGKPLSMMIDHLGQHQVVLVLLVIPITIAAVAAVILRAKPKVNQDADHKQLIKVSDLRYLITSPAVWILAIANLLMVGSLEGFADVWGVNYFITAYALPKAEAAELVSFVFVGMLFGGPILANVSRRFGNYSIIAVCGIGMAIGIMSILFIPVDLVQRGWLLFAGIFFGIGIMCCYQVLVFAAGSELVSKKLLGVTIAFLNCINMLGGSFFHSLIGRVMDLSWAGALSPEGCRLYDIAAYQFALSIIPLCALVGVGLVLILPKINAARKLRAGDGH